VFVVGLGLLLYHFLHMSEMGAAFSNLKSHGRSIWCGVINGQTTGKIVWPKDLGFTRSQTSTEYFRRLLYDKDGQKTDNPTNQLVENAVPHDFGGWGINAATSLTSFAANNNAWVVICVDSNAPPDTAFLVSRNAFFGAQVSTTSKVTRVKSHTDWCLGGRIVWTTKSGACCDADPDKVANLAASMFPDSNAVYDVLYP